MRRSVVLALGLVALILLAGLGSYVFERQRQDEIALAAERQKEAELQRADQSRAAADNLRRLEDQTSAEALLQATLAKEDTTFYDDRDAALKVSNERHDASVNGSVTVAEALTMATDEQSIVQRMGDEVQALADTSNSIADLFEKLYGADAVRSYRGHIQDLLTQRQLYLSHWSRAVGDVVDIYKLQENGQPPGDTTNAEAMYQESDDDATRGAAILRTVATEKIALEKRLSDDLRNAKHQAAQLSLGAPTQ